QWNAPTICDSTIALGMCLTAYYVSARAYNGSDHYDSNAKRGYSVDNLAPGPPQNVTAAYNTGSGNHLTWDRPSDPDVAYSGVYRDDELIAYTTMDEWVDTEYDGWTVTYQVSAVDTSGNEGPKAGPGQTTAVETPRDSDELTLRQNVPNPFNPTTTIAFVLPERTRATLAVYDVSGRLVSTLVSGVVERGNREYQWNGTDTAGNRASTGVYFYRLTAGEKTLTKKMVLLK
ncbi:MAG: FlgD immunoglobulin-like domain containing protein, partial [bacterium]